MGHFVIWTDEQSEALRTFVAEGLTYRECARAINERFNVSFTRSALIGKAMRMGLTSPAKPPPKNPPRPKRDPSLPRYARQAPKAPPPRAVIEMRCDAIEPLNLNLLDLEAGQCRWPYGEINSDGGTILFCGHPILCGSYCSAHYQLSIGPGTHAERAAA